MVLDLEYEPHVRVHGDPLIACQGEDLVVIHHRVEALDPARVDVAVQHDPLGALAAAVGRVPATNCAVTLSILLTNFLSCLYCINRSKLIQILKFSKII